MNDTDRNSIFSILLPYLHCLLAVDLNNGSSLIQIAPFAQLLHFLVPLHVLALLHHWHGFTSQRAFVDQQLSLQKHALEGDLDSLIHKDYITRHNLKRRDVDYSTFPQHVQIDLVVGHLEELFICLHYFVYRYGDSSDCADDDHRAVSVVMDL